MMDWKTLFVTFGVVFLAELGDKTQLMAMALSTGRKGGCISVFLGSSLALMCTSALAVFAGTVLARYIPQKYLLLGSAVLFILLGIAMLANLAWKSGQTAV
ncbi:MAG: TMEM165/GDT1 family protein [Lentisphaeria bacterium]|jgi:putative Ca2+/H+ antiporter (TMEM165/GDT1 family)|nr:TMEM165/GDT1 family protein [Lentisphaeria bacterium]